MKVLLLVILFIHYCEAINCQQAIVSVGGQGIGIGGTVSYTVGQIVYESIEEDELSILQGVQHPFEIFTIGVHIPQENFIDVTVYPNPTRKNLILHIINNNSGIIYHLYNTEGKLLEFQKIKDTDTEIPMDKLPPSTYILQLLQNNENIKFFKIIKY